jgi:hypothetical protein
VGHLQQILKNSKKFTVPCGQRGGPLPIPNISIMFASIGKPNAIKKSGIPNNFFSNCAIKRGIHQQGSKSSEWNNIRKKSVKKFK